MGVNIIHTKVVGVTFEGRQEVIKSITKETIVFLKREPGNEYDENAVAVYVIKELANPVQIGYIKKELAADIGPAIDSKINYLVKILDINHKEGNYGVNISIELMKNKVDNNGKEKISN